MKYILFACPDCQARVTSAPQYAGLSGSCPSCEATITVPTLSAEEPETPPPENSGKTTLATRWPTRSPGQSGSSPGV